MPQKIPSTGDLAHDAPGSSQRPAPQDPGTRIGRAFAQLGTYIEDSLESALDMYAIRKTRAPASALVHFLRRWF